MAATWQHLLKPLALGVGLVALSLLALGGNGAPPPVRAAGPTCTVCPAGGGCDYADIQAAVDDLGCAEIKVAQGVYTGVQARPAPAGYLYPPASGLIVQVVYVSRTLAVRGGYTTTNWTTPYPLTQPTTLDADGLGRVLVIAGDISPRIEGLNLTNGRGVRQGGCVPDLDCGSGAYIISATATLSANNVTANTANFDGGGLVLYSSPAILIANNVTSNTALWGGGLWLRDSPATLIANNVTANAADNWGGGLELYSSPATLIANNVTANTAGHDGGGLYLYYSSPTLIANSVAANTAVHYGGGLYLIGSPATLISNNVTANTAAWGGGLYLDGSPATLSANSVSSNTTGYSGGGLYLVGSPATLISNSVTANTAGTAAPGGYGGGLYVSVSAATVSTNTVTSNTASNGGGIYLDRCPATLSANSITSNTARANGGGVYLSQSNAMLSSNRVATNTSLARGGGFYLWSSFATLTNTIIADNRAGTYGTAMVVASSTLKLLHTTIARNGGDDSALRVEPNLGESTVWLTNTILVSHTMGITTTTNKCTVFLNGTLWYGNGAKWGGAGTFIHSGDIDGDPAFVDPNGGDYHTRFPSPAVNHGVNAGVTTDKDGRLRDVYPDLGAYEFVPLTYTYLPAIIAGHPGSWWPDSTQP